jgi:conjugal transfer pilus assembly protein TraA
MTLTPRTRAKLITCARKAAEYGVAAIGVAAATALVAHAGTDTTFSTTTTSLTDWTTGSLGKMAAVGAVAVGIVGTILRFDWKLIAGGVGIGLAAATGPGIVSGLTSAIF